jgi:hypothetical protein
MAKKQRQEMMNEKTEEHVIIKRIRNPTKKKQKETKKRIQQKRAKDQEAKQAPKDGLQSKKAQPNSFILR